MGEAGLLAIATQPEGLVKGGDSLQDKDTLGYLGPGVYTHTAGQAGAGTFYNLNKFTTFTNIL